MAQTKVSDLTALTSPDGSQELLVNDGGTSKKITIDNLLYDESIDSDHYVDGSIDNAHLADDAVGVDELSATGTASSSTFLRGDNAWATPTDTDTMGSGFTVSATTDTTPTTITQGDDLMFTASTGITTETTADGTVTITNTVSGASTATSSATGVVKIEDDTDQSVAANTVSATAGRTYGIQLNSSDQAVVNVPWTDTDTNTTYSNFTGDSGSGGAAGLVPAPSSGDAAAGKYLDSSGSFTVPPDTDTNTNQLTTFTVSATTDSNATTISQGDDLMFTAGTGITCETTADGTVTITNTVSDTNTTYTAGDGLDLTGTAFSTDLKSNGGVVIESTELAVDLGASSITGTLAVGDGGTGLTAVGSAGQLLTTNSGASAAEWADAPQGVSNSKLFYFGSFS